MNMTRVILIEKELTQKPIKQIVITVCWCIVVLTQRALCSRVVGTLNSQSGY